MQRYCARALAVAISALLIATVHAQPQESPPQATKEYQSPPQLNADAEGGFRIEFLGKEPSSDWARVADKLVQEKLVPLETLRLSKGQDECSAVLEQLNFRNVGLRCSDAMRALIRKLNPDLPASPPINAQVNYPNLPIGQMNWYAGFDRSIPAEADRYKKVTEAWKVFKTGEKSAGSQVQVEFRGFHTSVAPSAAAEASKALTEIERYDPKLQRYDTRVLELSKNPLLKGFSMDDPIEWGKACQDQSSPPPPPPPSYISLLGGSKDDLICASKCNTENCPEIVLIDQAVAPHPDIVVPPPNQVPATKLCPFVKFDPLKNHGTHLAGLMVSSGLTGGFRGLAPKALLDAHDVGTLLAQNIPAIAKAKNLNYARPNVIFVFASQFPDKKSDVLTTSERRYTIPRYVEDILNSPRLWIVAAGQKSEQQPERLEIGLQTNASPMNLGDRGMVLVVTACENCYSKDPRIASWANFSGPKSGGLVNIAAPGGSPEEKIPGPVTKEAYGLANGTSQAAALVGGLAAAMMSCYPDTYHNAQLLKTRILATARPPLSPDVAQKVATGIVDAKRALLDPGVHWVTRKSTNGVQEQYKDLKWCTQNVTLNDPDSDDTLSVDVRKIRALVRDTTAETSAWFVAYQKETGGGQTTIRFASLATPPDKLNPLLYFRTSPPPAPVQPLPLEDFQDLLVGLNPKATSEVPPDFIGCK